MNKYGDYNSSLSTPLTYLLDLSTERFSASELALLSAEANDTVWFEKLNGWQHGKCSGITIITDLAQYKEDFKTNKSRLVYFKSGPQEPGSHLRILQQNVEPYLVNGQKIEVRLHVLIASLEPYVVLFRDGFISMTVDRYQQRAPKNHEADRFNYFVPIYIQSQHPMYNHNSLFWDYRQLSMYMEELYKYHLNHGGTQAQVKRFKAETKKMLAYYFEAIRNRFPDRRISQYTLLGCDVAISKDFEPKLLECNAMPGVMGSHLQPSLKTMKETVFESLDLMLGVFEASRGNKSAWQG